MISNFHFSSNDKAVICALFLSKFDKQALFALGFKTWTEVFNVISLSVGVSYSSINQYRNIFDYYFPDNPRKGWDKNKIGNRNKEMEIMKLYQDYTFEKMLKIVKEMIFENYETEEIPARLDDLEKNKQNQFSIAQRLITGQAAEQYFINNHQKIDIFENGKIEDTRMFGCGFDFKIHFEETFLAVEVKGLAKKSGNLLLIEKEYKVANNLQENFILFVVKNFAQQPEHLIFTNPINYSNLNFRKTERTIIQTSYQCSI